MPTGAATGYGTAGAAPAGRPYDRTGTVRSVERRCRAMGSTLHVVVVAPGALADALADRATAAVCAIERRWSRFVPGSEVASVNRGAGGWTAVSPSTLDLVERALLARALTDGRFDPTVDVAAIGYDRPFAQLSTGSAGPDRRGDASPRTDRGRGRIDVDRAGGAVRLAAGVGFDPGGIGKGLAADLVSADLLERGAVGVLVNIGGDLRVRGRPPAGDAWGVTVHEPAWRREPLARLAVLDAGVATSTTCRRRFEDVHGRERHHVIDPSTGASTTERAGDVVIATTIAGEAWWAEAAATAAIVPGHRVPTDVEMATGRADGGEHRTAGFGAFER